MNTGMFVSNRKKLIKNVVDSSITILFSGEKKYDKGDAYYPFESNRNFYYLTGLKRENYILVIVKQNYIGKVYLFIEERDEYYEKWNGKRLSIEEVSKISSIEKSNIKYSNGLNHFLKKIMSNSKLVECPLPSVLNIDIFSIDNIKPNYYLYHPIIKNYPELKVNNINMVLGKLRMIKNDFEIKELSKAIGYTKNALEEVLMNILKCENEYEVESLFEYSVKKQGSNGLGFTTIAASGRNATVLHYIDNNDMLGNDQLILLDLGAVSGYYTADISRTYPVSGKFNKRQREVYESVLYVNKKCIEFVKPGISWKSLNDYAKELLTIQCISLGLIKNSNELSKYYYHSVSHYLGLDVHDSGDYSSVLRDGMVITIEPGLYITEESIGIRIEDDILITSDGCINLSKDIIKEVNDIELFIKKSIN